MVVLVVCALNTLFKRFVSILDMYTHLAWCWWAADPVRLMTHTRDEMESLRRWRLSEDVWDVVTPRIQAWVLTHVPEYTPDALQAFADRMGKAIHTHILYHIILPVIRPIHVYKRHIPFHETLRRT